MPKPKAWLAGTLSVVLATGLWVGWDGSAAAATQTGAASATAASATVAYRPATIAYRVAPGDTLWLLSQRYETSVAAIINTNRLRSNYLQVGQPLFLPILYQPTQNQGYYLYRVQKGDTLWLLAQRIGTITVSDIQRANGITSDYLWVGQALKIPVAKSGYQAYQVQPGDSLYLIARKLGTTVDDLVRVNRLSGYDLLVGQVLMLPGQRSKPAPPPTPAPQPGPTPAPVPQPGPQPEPQPAPAPQPPAAELSVYRVVAGDTLWGIAQKFGTTQNAIYQTNRLHSDILMPGQPLYIPPGAEPVQVEGPRGTQKPGYGELLEWDWARWIYNPGCTATVIDFYTGRSFRVRHLGGSNHADSEPLTAADTAVMKSVFGGQWSWAKRPILLRVGDRLLAASMAGMPHSVETIYDNNFPGHFDLYFYNSRSHNTNALDPVHQANVLTAAGQ
ncbi:MAG: LysM peptidoglycan-binding domain-containing protein [Clostridia bacterium]|nr:LysM peptidoglycan-binding domain-containing protein [Clostridia bacterium]